MSAERLTEWACGVVGDLPPSAKREGLKWLFPRLAALEVTDLELLVPFAGKRLELDKRFLRRQVRDAEPWVPSPPRAQRDADAERARKHMAEARAQEDQSQRRRGELETEADVLLRDPGLLYKALLALSKVGLAGERITACITFLALVSRILSDPTSLTVKGDSAAGKSFLVQTVLKLFPLDAYLAMTGMSRQAFVDSEEPLAHRTVVVFERPGMDAADYNIRTLQSEGKIIFDTVERDPATNEQRTVRKVKDGPTNFIFTTTAPQIHQENETRHWPIVVDESETQTARVKGKIAEKYEISGSSISDEELEIWRTLQGLLQSIAVRIPYARWLADRTPDGPIRMRRDFTRLLALIECIALFFQRQRTITETELGAPILDARLEDYYIARTLVGENFGAEVRGRNVKSAALVAAVVQLYGNKLVLGVSEPTVNAGEVASLLDKDRSTVNRWLKSAVDKGWVEQAAAASGPKGAEYVPGAAMPDPDPLPPVENWLKPSQKWPLASRSSTRLPGRSWSSRLKFQRECRTEQLEHQWGWVLPHNWHLWLPGLLGLRCMAVALQPRNPLRTDLARLSCISFASLIDVVNKGSKLVVRQRGRRDRGYEV